MISHLVIIVSTAEWIDYQQLLCIAVWGQTISFSSIQHILQSMQNRSKQSVLDLEKNPWRSLVNSWSFLRPQSKPIRVALTLQIIVAPAPGPIWPLNGPCVPPRGPLAKPWNLKLTPRELEGTANSKFLRLFGVTSYQPCHLPIRRPKGRFFRYTFYPHSFFFYLFSFSPYSSLVCWIN